MSKHFRKSIQEGEEGGYVEGREGEYFEIIESWMFYRKTPRRRQNFGSRKIRGATFLFEHDRALRYGERFFADLSTSGYFR